MLKELTKSILVYGVASSIGKFIGFFLLPIYTRTFSPAEYGVVDLISTIIVFVCILGMLQLESAISRYYISIKDDEERHIYISTAFWTITVLSILWTTIILFLADNISIFLFKTSEYKNIIIVASIVVPFSNIFSFLTVLMRYKKKPIVYSIFVMVQLLTTVGVSIWLILFRRIGIIGVFYGQLAGYVLVVCVMLLYLKILFPLKWNWNILKKFFRYSLPLVPTVALNYMNSYVSRFIILGYLSIADLGVFSVALKIASVFRMLDNAVRMAWGPFMWEEFEKTGHQEIFKRIMKLISSGIFFLIVALALFSEEISTLLTTSEYENAIPLVGMLGFSIGLTIISRVIVLGPGIVKRTEFSTLVYSVSVVVNIIFLFILVPVIGLVAAPVSLLISTTISVGVGWWISEKLYFIGFSKVYFAFLYLITLFTIIFPVKLNISIFTKTIIMTSILIIFGSILFLGKEPVFSLNSVKNICFVKKRGKNI